MNQEDFDKTCGQVLKCAVYQQKNMHDSCFLVGGMEGTGKSDLIFRCIDYVDKVKGIETPLEHVAMNLKDFFMSLKVSNAGDVVSLDEGKELMSMNYGDKKLKDAINIFTVIRKKRLISFIAFTNPAKINQYFREDRIRGVFMMKKRTKEYSIVYYYSKKQFIKILEILRLQRNLNITSILQQKPLFSCKIIGAYDGRLKAAYENKKDDNIDQLLDELVNKYHKKEYKTYNMRDVMKLLNIKSTSTFYRIFPESFVTKYKQRSGLIEFTEESLKEIEDIYSNHIKNKKYNPINNRNGQVQSTV